MKNNIRYKGNTNNTSVIIFLNRKIKNSQRCYFARENLRGGFCCCCTFISFLIFILLLYLHLSIFVIHIYFFDIIPHPSVDYCRVFTPILYFQSSPSQSDSRYFHFQLFCYLLAASATVLSGRFLPTGDFYLMLLHQHF